MPPSDPKPTPSPTLATTKTPNLTLQAAQIATAAASTHATHLRVPMNIAIVDSSLHLLHFTRMPSAKLTSIDISISKAFTAAGHRTPTHNYREAVWPGGAAYGINLSNGGRFSVIGGGVPIMVDGACVGAVGVSGGTPAEDRACAEAGVQAVVEMVRREGHEVEGVKAKL